MNNNYYYHKYDNNFRMNFKNISYQEWVNDNLDNLIYSFNNNSIIVNNWISLRSFINKILSSYSG